MDKKEAGNCWEYWDCEKKVRENCPAFKYDSGKECWMIAGSGNKEPTCPKVKANLISCTDCEWYKLNNK